MRAVSSADLIPLPDHAIECTYGLAVSLHPIISDRGIEVTERVLPRDPYPQLVIHHVMEAFVEQSDCLENLAPEKDCRLRRRREVDPEPQQTVERHRRRDDDLVWNAGLIDEITVPVDDGRVTSHHVAHSYLDRMRLVGIVGVEPGDDFPLSAFKALVNRVRLPAVRLAHPVVYPRLVLLDDLHGVVAAASVYDQIFKIRVVLEQNGAYRLLDEPALIERRCHDRHARPIGSIRERMRRQPTLDCPRPTRLPGWRRRDCDDGWAIHNRIAF